MITPNSLESLITGTLLSGLAGRSVDDLLPYWQMSYAERSAFLSVLREIEPAAAIEIGTAQGGSLAVLSTNAGKVYSLDIDPQCEARLKGRFSNVVFKCGPSQVNIPSVLEELQRDGIDLQFVLIDGDHSREGVKRDIELVLRYRPRRPMAILLHDSFNPFCRFGMRDADWAANPHVRAVELDFVPGGTIGKLGEPLEMWGGLGAALLTPEVRSGPLLISERNRGLFEEMLPRCAHAHYFGFTPGGDSGPGLSPTARSLYATFAGCADETLRGYLMGERTSGLVNEPAGFVEARTRLASRIVEWRALGRRVAIYGVGEHTRALLGLVPELYPLVNCFIDRRCGDTFLGRPCYGPKQFSPADADVVVYSSRAFETEMYATLAQYPVEHVRLYS